MTSLELVEKAEIFAKQHLADKTRIAGNSYYEHAKRVYEILQKHSIKDELTLSAALLHPLCDLKDIDHETIEKEFGSQIHEILNNYVLIKKSKFDKETPRLYNETFFIQAFLKLSKDVRTLVIRLADKYDNLLTSYALSKNLRDLAAQKVLYLYALLAKLIGLGQLSHDMEDEAFKILHPREYIEIEKLLKIKIHEAKKPLEDAQTFLKQILEENNIPAVISTRFKHAYGIYKKILRQSHNGSLAEEISNLDDVVAMRIIVDTVDSCYEVENLLSSMWDTFPEKRDDYIVKPRPSGYQSIHGEYKLSKKLKVEIQIRTVAMHEFNEYGAASHLLYKIGDKGEHSPAYKKLLDYTAQDKMWFKELVLRNVEAMDIQYNTSSPFSNKIYCFTPKGDIIELTKGATVLDFAYSLHTDLGNKCSAAYVNNIYVSLDKTLTDGDIVYIKTIKKNNVNADWLKMAKSAKTKAHIRKALLKE